MKWFVLVFAVIIFVSIPAFASEGHGASAEAAAPSPLTPLEQSLPLAQRFLRTDDHGLGYLEVQGEPLSVARILSLSPWDLMELVQILSGEEQPLRRFGNGDELTQAWRLKVAAFAASADRGHVVTQEDLFDPNLVLWDPGYIQNLNSWGKWTIRIDRRDIVQEDLPSLSPLEVQQAVAVLTGRNYPLEFVLDHLEAFRAQLSVVPRLAETSAMVAPHH